MPVLNWIEGCLTGGITGMLSAFGLGGGTLLLLWLSLFGGMAQQTAQGVNLLYFLPTAAASLPMHWKHGYLDGRLVAWAGGAGMVMAAVSADLAAGLETELLHKCFGVYLLAMGTWELVGWRGKPPSAQGGHGSREGDGA